MRLSASIEALQCLPPACDRSTLRARELAAISVRLDALAQKRAETSLWLPTAAVATTGLGVAASFVAVFVMASGNFGSWIANDDDAPGPFDMDRANAFAMAGLGFSSLFMASSGWLLQSLRTRSLVKYEAKALRVRQRELQLHGRGE